MNNVNSLHYDMRVLSYFGPLAMIMGAILICRKLEGSKKEAAKCMIVGLCMFQMLCVVILILEYQNVYLPYKDSAFQTIEGEVSVYKTDSVVESFEINGVEFKYTEKDMMLGYNKIKEKGGVILGDGQYIRIGYIQHTGRNVIVSIDM